jgi:acetyl esterase/lipase
MNDQIVKRRRATRTTRLLRELFRIATIVPHALNDTVVRVDRDVRFADHSPRLLLDVFSRRARTSTEARAPVVLYCHGGAWVHGSKVNA